MEKNKIKNNSNQMMDDREKGIEDAPQVKRSSFIIFVIMRRQASVSDHQEHQMC